MAKKSRVLLGMSGGVDSTYSALLLKEKGYEVIGAYMKLHDKKGYHEVHYKRAKRAAEVAGVALHLLDFREAFNQQVFQPFIQTYKEGRTPNPCALCNRTIKFGKLASYADEIEAEFIATGHYVKSDGQFLYCAEDREKDQSYFLFDIEKSVIPKLLFPLQDAKKEELKKQVAAMDELKSFAEQAESSEICFVDADYTDVLKKYVPVDREGDVVDLDGNVIGKHKGYMHYTIGKRRGFDVPLAHVPHYIVGIDAQNNRLIAATREHLSSKYVTLNQLNLHEKKECFEAQIKLRYRSKAVSCSVEVLEGSRANVKLHEEVFAIAPGQAGVLYDGERLIGGGWIE